MIETHRSFANRWQCDENGHINVQFYYCWFDEAAQIFALQNGQVPATGNDLISRHVRYYKELHDGDGTRISSGQIADGPFKGAIVHLLINSTTDEIAATALDHLKAPYNANHLIASDEANLALPRGLASGSISRVDSDGLLKSRQAIASNYSVVSGLDLAPNGQFITNRIISRFTDGAPHIWEHAGVTTEWLNETGNGRVAVEMKVDPVGSPNIGTALRLVSWVSEVAGKTMQVDHQLEELESRSVVAFGSVRCLVMNLTSRRSVELPETVKATHAA